MKKWLYAAALCLIAAIAAGGLIGQAGAEDGKDLLVLASYAEAQMEGAKEVVIRFGGEPDKTFQTEGWQDSGKKLAQRLGLTEDESAATAAGQGRAAVGSGAGLTPIASSASGDAAANAAATGSVPESAAADHGKTLFRASATLPYSGGTISLTLFDTGSGKPGYAVVKRELKAEHVPAEALAEWQRQAAELLAEQGLRGQWSVEMQGSPSEQALGSSAKTDSLLKGIGHFFAAKELERYTDNGTVSVTFSSRKLKGSVRSGMYRVSLQAALHKQTDNGRWRLTIGAPIVTREY